MPEHHRSWQFALATAACGLLLQPPVVGAQPGPAVLGVGDRLPRLAGEFLTGRQAALPDAAAGKVALVAFGFSYDSRVPVEAWAAWFKESYLGRPGVTLFEVPMIGGAGRLAKFFIDRGMRRGTPRELHENVITVYGGTGPWKQRLAVTDDTLAHLLVLDREGTVRWRHSGPFDAGAAAGAQTAIDTLLGAP